MKRLSALLLLLFWSFAAVHCGRYDLDVRDFGDYSSPYTRTDVANRNSAAAPPASGPYFAFELKEMAQQWNSLDYYDYFALPQTVVDYSGNAFHPQQFYPPLTYKRPSVVAPHKKRKPVRPKAASKTKNQAQKLDDKEIGDPLAPLASPNGVMGVLSVVAGIVWFMVNKSATPVVKMRADSDAREASGGVNVQHLEASWALQDAQCRRRAVCDLVNQRPSVLPYVQIAQTVLRSINSITQSITQ